MPRQDTIGQPQKAVDKKPQPVDSTSPYYELAKAIVDNQNLHDTINLNNYSAAINAVVQVLQERNVQHG
jgi:ABC-type transporter Mla subunit MlaD